MHKAINSIILFLFLIFTNQCLGQEALYCFDFGGAFQDVAPGYIPVSRVYHSPRYLWIDNVREVERMNVKDPLRRDFVGGPKGEFWIGLDNGDYTITLILGDSREAKGPFDIYLQNQIVKEDIKLESAKFTEYSFPVKIENQKLMLKLLAEKDKEFAINGLVISGSSSKSVRRIFEDAPLEILPSVDEVMSQGSTDTRGALKSMCEWLLSHRLANGFLGDYEPGKKVTNFYWYTTAYPIRTLLAGYEIFGDKRYLNAVMKITDVLVGEQLPNGAWQQIFRNKPAKNLTKQEIEDIYENEYG